MIKVYYKVVLEQNNRIMSEVLSQNESGKSCCGKKRENKLRLLVLNWGFYSDDIGAKLYVKFFKSK